MDTSEISPKSELPDYGSRMDQAVIGQFKNVNCPMHFKHLARDL